MPFFLFFFFLKLRGPGEWRHMRISNMEIADEEMPYSVGPRNLRNRNHKCSYSQPQATGMGGNHVIKWTKASKLVKRTNPGSKPKQLAESTRGYLCHLILYLIPKSSSIFYIPTSFDSRDHLISYSLSL